MSSESCEIERRTISPLISQGHHMHVVEFEAQYEVTERHDWHRIGNFYFPRHKGHLNSTSGMINGVLRLHHILVLSPYEVSRVRWSISSIVPSHLGVASHHTIMLYLSNMHRTVRNKWGCNRPLKDGLIKRVPTNHAYLKSGSNFAHDLRGFYHQQNSAYFHSAFLKVQFDDGTNAERR